MGRMGKMGETDVKNIVSTADRVDKIDGACYALDNFLRKGECVMKMIRTAMSMLMPMCMCRMSMRCCAYLRCADR